MIYRDYGQTGLTVSRLGYGVMRLPAKDDHVDMPAAVEVLRRAFDLAINFFDSHHEYHHGESELAIGEALGDVSDKIVIQTKCPYYRAEKKDDSYFDRFNTALKKVGREYIDLLLAHSISPEKWQDLGPRFMQFARSAKRNGLIRHIGFSSHADPEFVTGLIESGQFEAVLVPYNLIERRYAPCLARAHTLGLATAVMNPVGGGRLAAPNPQLAAMIDSPVHSTAELALRFAFANSDIDVVLSGMTNPEWVEENAAIAESDCYLSPADHVKIDNVLAEKSELAKLYCTGCGYCMPCPQGVDIPFNFNLLNMYRLYGLKEWAGAQYATRLKATREQEKDRLRASACTECQACLPKCPNKLPIVEQLREVNQTLGQTDDK